MAKTPTVNTITSGYASQTQLNENFTNIRTAFENTLSLDGSTPNAMAADLDLNDNDILNIGSFQADAITLGGSSVNLTDLQAISGIGADIQTLAHIEDGTDATDAIQTVAGISSNVSTVSGISANVTTVAGISSQITAVVNDATDIGTVASNISSVNTVANNITEVVAVANDLAEAVSEIETVANDLNETTSEIDTVANNITNVNAVGNISSNVTTVAGISSNVSAVAGISSAVSNVSSVSSDISTVSGISSNVTTVAGISSNVTSVANISSDVTAVASINTSDLSTVANISADVTSVANISTEVNTVADNLTDVTNFFAIYRTGTSEPSTSLDTGDLFYNTSTGTLKIYNGSAWEAGVTAGSGFLAQSSNLSDVQSAATARQNLGLEIGADVQAYDATIVVDADIGVTVQGYDATILKTANIGSTVQAYDAQLADVASLTPTNTHAIVGDGANFISTSSSTAAMLMPVGTEAQRPSSPANGMIRYSTTSGNFEGYQAGAWAAIGGGGDVGAPTLSGSSSGNEFSDTTVTITDYNASLIYRVSVTGGSYVRSGGTITWTLPSVATDTVHYLTVNAIDNGVTSPDAEWDIDVLNVAFTGDTGIQITDFSSNTSNTGWTV